MQKPVESLFNLRVQITGQVQVKIKPLKVTNKISCAEYDGTTTNKDCL